MKGRAEWFGAVLALDRPRGIVSVNRAMARLLGFSESPRWKGSDPGHLSAPTEVHLVLSRRCSAGCRGCYVSASARGAAMSGKEAKAALATLARLGIFHVALGGGEALEHGELFEIAHCARSLGLVPNLTTNGFGVDAAMARRCRVFGQVNVSLDGVGDAYRDERGVDGYARAERALRLLRAERREVGINAVVTRQSFERLGEIAALARRLRLNEVELLRFKPVGRGRELSAEAAMTGEQARELYPRVRWLSLRHRIRVKLDCSFAPMVFFHGPSKRAASFFGVVGCQAGNLLAAVTPEGALTGCSFAARAEAPIADEQAVRRAFEGGFSDFRTFRSRARPPCSGCESLAACNGGCRAIAEAEGDWWQPDPGCPRAAEWRARYGP